MLLLIDNYDSFTFNLVQEFQTMGEAVRVFRNDEVGLGDIESLVPSSIVISPGPGTPHDAGISMKVVDNLGPKIPLLGVCLGHQAIGAAFGGRIVRANRIMHGKASAIYHDGQGVYRGLPNPFEAIRYHSLIVENNSLPDCLEVSAWTEEGEIMGLRHRVFPVEGVQFHPESILTHEGPKLLRNFVSMATDNLRCDINKGGKRQ